jgi:hypothetical protein
MGPQFHYWLSAKKKEGDNKSQKFLAKLYPNMKSDEIDLMARINDTKEICESMKGELYQMKKKIDSKEFATSISEYQYRMKLPEIYLKSSTEYIKVCGAFNDK